jgi:hypothetical protein
MSPAARRFEALRDQYRALIPSQKISRKRRNAVAWAASLEQVRETIALEAALGRLHDRALLETMRREVQALLLGAGARFNSKGN